MDTHKKTPLHIIGKYFHDPVYFVLRNFTDSRKTDSTKSRKHNATTLPYVFANPK